MSDMRDRLARIEKGLDDPHVDVLDLVNWVYAEQQAHRSGGGLAFGYAGSIDSVHRVAQAAVLGCFVDKVGYNMGELHPIAEAVHGMVGILQDSGEVPAWLIKHYAASESAPPGYDLDVELGPAWKGEPRYDLHGLPRHGAFKIVHDGSSAKVPLYCPLAESHGAEYQAELRREYEHWHLALRRLVALCARSRELGRMVVTGPAISAEPWRERGEADLPVRGPRSASGPSRRPESKPTRSPVQDRLLAILLDATNIVLVRDDDGLWRALGAVGAAGYGEALINRVVSQGLAFKSREPSQGRVRLVVTPRGHEQLKAACLVA